LFLELRDRSTNGGGMRLFVITGAGVPAESGLGTFGGRAGSGDWPRFDPTKLATRDAFARNPQLVHAFDDVRRRKLIAARSNAAHFALARLEAGLTERGGNFTLVTHNFDDLLARAGSQHVIHKHGEPLKARCTTCDVATPWRGGLSLHDPRHNRGHTGALRPHVVWLRKTPLEIDAILTAQSGANLLVAIETSGSVYPAADFVAEAKALGIRTCEINLEPSATACYFDQRRYGLASKIIPTWVEEILSSRRLNPP
jgi:NAD-dependent deacetylase